MTSQIVEDFLLAWDPARLYFVDNSKKLAFPLTFFCQTSKSMELQEKTYTNDNSSFV